MRRISLIPLVILLAGCSGDSPKFARVSGQVTLNGQPLANAAVVFSPMATGNNVNPGPGSGGKTDADGRYSLTVVGKDVSGAVIGKHRVNITLIGDSDTSDDRRTRPKLLPPKYQGKDTTLEFTVPAGGTDSANFPLTVP